MRKFTSLMIGMVIGVVLVGSLVAGETVGTRIGNAALKAGVQHGIAIGGGNDGTTNDTGIAYVTADGAGQIGNGSNTTANTLKFGTQWVVLSATNSTVGAFDAAQLTAGSTASAINGTSITNLTAANIAAGGTFKPNQTFGGNVTINTNLSVGGTLGVTGAQQNGSTFGASGAAIFGSTVAATGAVTMASTLGVTGMATFTAIPKLGAALGTPGNVTFVVTNAPVGASTIPKWLVVKDVDGTTNYVMCLQF